MNILSLPFSAFPESTIKNICVRTATSLILGPSKLLTSEGTGAHHLSGDAICAAESAQILSSRKADDELGASSRSRQSQHQFVILASEARRESFLFLGKIPDEFTRLWRRHRRPGPE